MFFCNFYHVRTHLIFILTILVLTEYTCGISVNKFTLFINNRNFESYRRPLRAKSGPKDQESNPNKYIDSYLSSPQHKNLFKNQVSSYSEKDSHLSNFSKSQSWSEIVYEEILKNRKRSPKGLESPFSPYPGTDPPDLPLKKTPYDFRLSPEGRMKLEDRIENLKRTAYSNPVKYKEQTPNLWIVRSSHGNYCELLEKDEDKIKSLVNRVRKYFSPSDLQILLMKIDVKMPLCEIFVEGTMTDLVRILYARGGTLQFYVTPRFWTRCELIEKDARLEAKYGKATAPGLFPQWDEDGMVEEIIDCLDTRPDYALEFRVPNAWHLIPMMPEHDKNVMQVYFDAVHWPTRLKVQDAFEKGVEDYRIIIEKEYENLQKISREDTGILERWMASPNKFD